MKAPPCPALARDSHVAVLSTLMAFEALICGAIECNGQHLDLDLDENGSSTIAGIASRL